VTTDDGYGDLERMLGDLTVPEDLAQRHLARMEAARGTSWLVADPDVVVPIASAKRRRALRATVGGIVLGGVLVSGAGVAAASTSRPGDALYGVKTTRERIQLAMTRPGDSRARLEVRLARTRLAEAAELFRDDQFVDAIKAIARADAALASAAAQGGDEIDALVAAELDHRVAVLSALITGGLPDTAADAAHEALERVLDRELPARPEPAKGPHATTPPAHGTPTPVPSANPAGKPATHPTGRPTETPGRGDDHPTGRPSTVPSRGPR
jgi:hypothetical protein